MILFLLLLISLLTIIIIFYWFTNRKLSQIIHHNDQMIAHNNTLLTKMMVTQEKAYQHIGQVLHSSLGTKLHTIDIALYNLRKMQPQTLRLQQMIGTIAEATHTSRKLIDEVVEDITSITLNELGLLPALQELVEHYNVRVTVTGFAEPTAASLVDQQLYQIVKIWLEQAILVHNADNIQINWEKNKRKWTLIYSDNGNYPPHFPENSYLVSARLSILQAQIQYNKTSICGREILIKN